MAQSNPIHPKVKASGGAGLVVAVVVLIAGQFGYSVDPVVQSLLTTLVMLVAAYCAPQAAPTA